MTYLNFLKVTTDLISLLFVMYLIGMTLTYIYLGFRIRGLHCILKSICLLLLNWEEYNSVSIGCYLGNEEHLKTLERKQCNWEEKHT